MGNEFQAKGSQKGKIFISPRQIALPYVKARRDDKNIAKVFGTGI
jgi:hypothetical protein